MSTDRYLRQTILPQIGVKGQETISKQKVIIIGCGALGTTIASNLARSGIGEISLVDRDLVELHNLHRQILFDEEDIGTLKAPTAAAKLQKVNSEIVVHPIVKDINFMNIESIISNHHLVLDATDNFSTRLLLNDYCVKNKIPWIYGGVIKTSGMAMVITENGPCYRCMMPELPPSGSFDTCETAGILNSIPMIIGSIESTLALQLLLGHPFPTELLYFNGWDMDFQTYTIEKNTSCPCCQKKEFKYLEQANQELISLLCDNAVQIIPPPKTEINLSEIAEKLKKITKVNVSPFLIQFQAENKDVTLFDDGRALIRGTGDKNIARSIYAKYIGK